MNRRAFIDLLGGAAAWPLAAPAENMPRPVIGFLSNASPGLYATRLRAFRDGLREAGYVEGQNVAIEFRWADGEDNRLPMLAAELVDRQVAVVVAAGGAPSALAAKRATTTIPIVFGVAADPIEIGLVASLNRPGGNATGITTLNVELGRKRLEFLHEAVPAATSLALLINPVNPVQDTLVRDLQAAALALGLKLHILNAKNEPEIDAAFASLVQLHPGGLVISPDIFFLTRSEQLAALSLRHTVPAIFQNRPFAAAGGLMSYGGDQTDYYRRVGLYAGRVLKGEKPSDLPVQQATKVELIINLKTAKALRIDVPAMLLARADEVIE